MIKKQVEEGDSIQETIELTAKLERNLRKLMTNRNHEKTLAFDRGDDEEEMVVTLQREVRKLREEKKELFADNQQICRDVLRLRDQNREVKKELNQHKKCIAHLQGYNEELKKELLFWMRKPTKGMGKIEKQQGGADLMGQILKLRRENEARQNELLSLRNTLSAKDIQIGNQKKISLRIDSLSRLNKKEGQVKSKLHNKSTNDCTSCNYLEQSATKKKKIAVGSARPAHKRQKTKNLCECHRKYVQTSEFMH